MKQNHSARRLTHWRGVRSGNSVSLAANPQRGLAYIFLLVTITALLFLAFGTVQMTHGISRGLFNIYRALQTAQRMQGNAPYKAAALDNAVWVARLNDLPAFAPEEGAQTIGNAKVSFTYDDGDLPHTMFVRYADTSTLLNRFMAGAMSAFGLSGLHSLQTEIELGATSMAPLLDIYADISASMGSRISMDSEGNSPIKALLEAYGLEAVNGPEQISALCGPISLQPFQEFLGKDGLSADQDLFNREICMLLRASLPAFYAPGRAKPEAREAGSPPPIPFNKKPRAYDLSAADGYEPDSDPRMFCGDPAATDRFLRNSPGMRTVELDPRTCSRSGISEATGCNPFIDPLTKGPSIVLGNGELNSGLFNDGDQCHFALLNTLDWMTEDELAWCNAAPPNPSIPEIFFGGRCTNQISLLAVPHNDLAMAYRKLTQAFLIAVSDIVSTLRFSIFAATSPAGNFRTLSHGTGNERQFWGTYLLYDGTTNPQHLYESTIDAERAFRFEGLTTSTNQPVYNALAYSFSPGSPRFNHMQAYLDPNHNDIDIGAKNALSVGPRAFMGSQYLMPLPHPRHPWGSGLPGRTATFELSAPDGVHPADAGLLWTWGWASDFANPSASRFFPSPQDMQPIGASLNPPYPMDKHYFDAGSSETYKGRYAFWPLREVDNSGNQTGHPYIEETNIKNNPVAVFNYTNFMSGGTDHHAVFRKLREAHQSFRALQSRDTKQTYVALIITDGESSLPCDQPILDIIAAAVLGLPGELVCDGMSADDHYTKVKQELEAFEAIGAPAPGERGNTLTIVLFIQHEPPSTNAQRFLDLFHHDSTTNTNKDGRVLFTFGFTDTEDFREKFRQALSFISVLIRTATVLTRR